uniref:Carboxypeptidase n=1 Tax=Ciona savignyi TaxID=51511 RepID=H2Z5S9_CIOSA
FLRISAIKHTIISHTYSGSLCVFTNGGSLDDVKSDWGYVDVRQDAHMFWWLFFHDTSYQPSFLPTLDPVPVILWLQGGPGASGTGYGNFEELGPLDLDLNRRETSWTGLGHVLFVDNPVGSGFSYVSNSNAYTTDIDQIAADMVSVLKGFYATHPELLPNPFYIMCESYGGKIGCSNCTGTQLTSKYSHFQEMEAGTFNINLQGTGLGDGWISAMDSVNSWGPYLYQTWRNLVSANSKSRNCLFELEINVCVHDKGLLDDAGLSAVNKAAAATQASVDAGDWVKATNRWSLTESVTTATLQLKVDELTNQVIRSDTICYFTFYKKLIIEAYAIHVDAYQADPLDTLMNGYVKNYLGIPASVTWGGQSNDVFNAQSGDFMKPVILTVDQLIDTGMKVVVYNGQLDLIVDTPGQEMWMKKLSWGRLGEFMAQDFTPMYAYQGQDTGGFSKKMDNFEFWWVLKAGHMVPAD